MAAEVGDVFDLEAGLFFHFAGYGCLKAFAGLYESGYKAEEGAAEVGGVYQQCFFVRAFSSGDEDYDAGGNLREIFGIAFIAFLAYLSAAAEGGSAAGAVAHLAVPVEQFGGFCGCGVVCFGEEGPGFAEAYGGEPGGDGGGRGEIEGGVFAAGNGEAEYLFFGGGKRGSGGGSEGEEDIALMEYYFFHFRGFLGRDFGAGNFCAGGAGRSKALPQNHRGERRAS